MNSSQTALFLKLLNFDIDRIRQLFAKQAEQFFAHDFRSKETFAFIGNLLFRIQRYALRQTRTNCLQQFVDLLAALGTDRHNAGKIEAARHLLNERQEQALVVVFIDFIDHQPNRASFWQQRHYLGIGSAEFHRFDHEQHHVHVTERFAYAAIQGIVEGIAVFGLKTGRINKNGLAFRIGKNTGDTMACGLRLA